MSRFRYGQDKQRDSEMIDYLLGGMSKEAEEQFEERYFADDELFEQLLISKNELIDDYLVGRLSDPDRERFERCFLNSASWQEDLTFSHALLQKLPTADIKDSSQSNLGSVLRLVADLMTPRIRVWITASVIGLLAIAVGWLGVKQRRLNAELSRLRAERALQIERERELQQQLAELRTSIPSSPDPPVTSPAVTPSPPYVPPISTQPVSEVIALTPLSLRAGPPEKLHEVVVSLLLKVKLLLDDEPEYQVYMAVLQSSDGREIERRTGLRARNDDVGYYIMTSFARPLLNPGEYRISLFGRDVTGIRKTPETYGFIVKR